MKTESFRDLVSWQKAHQLVLQIYNLTKSFPSDERFGLVSQMRRAAVSIPANIAEGYRKRSVRERVNFYGISQASLEELLYYLILSRDLRYLNSIDEELALSEEVSKMLSSMIRRVNAPMKVNTLALTLLVSIVVCLISF